MKKLYIAVFDYKTPRGQDIAIADSEENAVNALVNGYMEGIISANALFGRLPKTKSADLKKRYLSLCPRGKYRKQEIETALRQLEIIRQSAIVKEIPIGESISIP